MGFLSGRFFQAVSCSHRFRNCRQPQRLREFANPVLWLAKGGSVKPPHIDHAFRQAFCRI
jgi:hypothetical protein